MIDRSEPGSASRCPASFGNQQLGSASPLLSAAPRSRVGGGLRENHQSLKTSLTFSPACFRSPCLVGLPLGLQFLVIRGPAEPFLGLPLEVLGLVLGLSSTPTGISSLVKRSCPAS
jgi:hypothetical protein